MVPFAVQKRLSFIRSYLFIFVIIFITLEGGFKKILQKQKQKDIAMIYVIEWSSYVFL